jgi:phenylacetate-CoA ligase
VPPHSAGVWRQKKVRLYDALYRRTTESCFDIAESEVDRLHASLARTRPDAIVAYTNAIYTLARLFEARGLTPYRPGSIVIGAEKLHDFQRTVIERVFRAPVFETYGSREFMLMAAECPAHAGLHLTMEHHLVEVLDDAGLPVAPGVEGNVVVTDLTNRGMPFVRYANGDRAIASAEHCACGRGLPLLAAVTGRRLDVLQTPDGGRLPGEFFPHLIKEIPAVQRFQVIQDNERVIRLRVVAPAWREADAAWLRGELAAVAPSLTLDIQLVPEIALTPTGKLQVVVNTLAANGPEQG